MMAAYIPNRFERIELEPDGDYLDAEDAIAPATVFYRDSSRSIIATNDSPDVMRGEGIWADQLKAMFKLAKRRAGWMGSFHRRRRRRFEERRVHSWNCGSRFS
jgi:hypothetical protein